MIFLDNDVVEQLSVGNVASACTHGRCYSFHSVQVLQPRPITGINPLYCSSGNLQSYSRAGCATYVGLEGSSE